MHSWVCQGGEDREVTEASKLEYARLLCEHRLAGHLQVRIFPWLYCLLCALPALIRIRPTG